jgi:hypothetical protein
MLCAYLNANYDFKNYLTAYLVPGQDTRIYIRCESGFLSLDAPLQFNHDFAEEVMRVSAVFENCNDLDATESARFDNIIDDTFQWNDNDGSGDEINSYKAQYISAVDDFHLAEIIPRKSWDTIDEEAELNEDTIDLKFVDNYWQAAYILKATAIENIDGNLSFSWRSGLMAFALELYDIVAIRHDSGDGVINYTPVFISEISYNLDDFTVDITARLYFSATFDERIASIEPRLTTTLSKDYPPITPTAVGTTGGYGSASDYKERRYPNYDYLGDAQYSRNGLDII